MTRFKQDVTEFQISWQPGFVAMLPEIESRLRHSFRSQVRFA